MSINHIETEDLRRMEGKDGLILQGCGGELQEWLDGINEMFTEAGILKNGAKFQDISAFEYDGLTCLLYPFEGVDLEIGKLAMWRLQTHENFGGTWLSDFVPNRLGGFIGEPAPEPEKPDCALIGQDGNIFNLVGKRVCEYHRYGTGIADDRQRRIAEADRKLCKDAGGLCGIPQGRL